MEKITKASIIIYDDFNNILILQRGKVKKGDIITWDLIEKEVKGKSTPEKTILKAVDKDIKCTIFELEEFKRYENSAGEDIIIFKGMIKERVNLHKSINECKWIKLSELSKHTFNEDNRKIIEEFFLN